MKESPSAQTAAAFMAAGLAVILVAAYGLTMPLVETGSVLPISLSLTEQTIITLAAFGLKPLYQLLSLMIAIMLWKRKESDLVAIRWAMLAFFAGENACALNYLVFHEQSLLMEVLHSYGMAICFGMAVYAVMEIVDTRILHYSEQDKKCALLPMCGSCYKYGSAACTLRSLFLFIIPATAVTVGVPLTAVLGIHLFEGSVFGSAVIFGQPLAYQVLEVRYYPLLSLVPLTVSFALLLRHRENAFESSKLFYAMGIGPLGFSLMRFILYWGYRENPLWADAWEEITEFLFIGLVFWIVVRIRSLSRESIHVK